jgi:drug/metabolite transporter (DMT)-like permease
MGSLGALAALGSSVTWAFASVRYAQVSREIGSARVNLARALVVGPLYLALAALLHGGRVVESVTLGRAGWLALSVICSYVLADTLFLSAAKRVGVSTALSIASTYPLWAVLVGVSRGESFGFTRACATLLCVAGVILLVRLAPTDSGAREQGKRGGLLLAGVTSVLWAGNSIAVKFGTPGLDVAQANGIRYSFALAMLAVAVRVREGKSMLPSRGSWMPLAPAIAADGIVGSSLYVYGLSHADLAIGATLSSLAPLISVPIAIVLGEEEWNGGRLMAVAMTVLGAVGLVSAA